MMHLRDALRRSEAELEMEREMRRRTEEDNEVERQLRYEVEGDIENQMARAAESEYRAENLKASNENLRFWNDWMKIKYEAMERSVRKERLEKLKWKGIVSGLTNGSEDRALDLLSNSELLHRISDTRCGRIRRYIHEAHREMTLDRQRRSREGTPLR